MKDRIRSEADTAGKEDDISFFMAQAFIELSEMIQIRDEVLAHADDFGIEIKLKRRASDKGEHRGEWQGEKKHSQQRDGKQKHFRGYRKDFRKSDRTKTNPGAETKNQRRFYSKKAAETKVSKSPDEYMKLVNNVGDEQKVFTLLDTGCSISIINRKIITDSFVISREELSEYQLELADGTSMNVSEKWKILVKASGAFGRDLYFYEWVIPINMNENSQHDLLLCFNTIIRLDLLGARFPVISDHAEDWEADWETKSCKFDQKCISEELRRELIPIVKDYIEQINPEQPAIMEPMIIEVAEDTPSIAYRARRLPARHAEFVREEIDRLMEKGIIVRAKSRFASPILVVPKKGNKFRMVIDYRRINT
ncbi:hypothetical protein ADUPG1_011696, partial [Aduncisulcus paluster]